MVSNNLWYNTISLSGEQLKTENAKALAQGELILAIFKANPSRSLSPSQLFHIFNKKYFLHPPITSIRRAVTNLTKDGVLIKTDERVQGLYHLNEYTWRLAENVEKTTDIFKEQETKKAFIQSDLFGG